MSTNELKNVVRPICQFSVRAADIETDIITFYNLSVWWVESFILSLYVFPSRLYSEVGFYLESRFREFCFFPNRKCRSGQGPVKKRHRQILYPFLVKETDSYFVWPVVLV